MALRRVLVDPEFIYRKEAEPAGKPAGATYRISDLELASRLSFFLWSSIPDEELVSVAAAGQVEGSAGPRAAGAPDARRLALAGAHHELQRAVAQYRALDQHDAVVAFFPDFDQNLRRSFIREIELFFGSVVEEDRSIIDLLTANYTFVDERLAKHYGIPNVYGSRFRRVELGPRTGHAPRAAGQGWAAHGDVTADPDVAGHPRPMVSADAAGSRSSGASGQRSSHSREGGKRGGERP